MNRSIGIVMAVVFVVALCCVPLAAILGDVSGAWQAVVSRLESDRLEAQAKANETQATLEVAKGESAILQQAALSVAADRHLVTLYAMSSNVMVLAFCVLAGGLVGFLAGKRREVNNHA